MLELPLIAYRDGGVKFIIPFIPSKSSFPSCTKSLGKGRVKFILNFNTGSECIWRTGGCWGRW